jgi:hypothetical protein
MVNFIIGIVAGFVIGSVCSVFMLALAGGNGDKEE